MTEEESEKTIKEVTEKIVGRFSPKKIILFGSRAWGKAAADSDFDFFVIMPSTLRRDRRSEQISRLFPERLFPLDALVYTPEEVENSLKRGNPFIKEILQSGRVTHES